jgi:hypothetical protein
MHIKVINATAGGSVDGDAAEILIPVFHHRTACTFFEPLVRIFWSFRPAARSVQRGFSSQVYRDWCLWMGFAATQRVYFVGKNDLR